MAQYGAHYATIQQHLDLFRERFFAFDGNVENADLTDPHYQTFNFYFAQDEYFVRRQIRISEIDRQNRFEVWLEESRQPLTDEVSGFVVSIKRLDFNADDETDLDFAGRRIVNFLTESIDPRRYPTVPMIQHLEKINHDWFKSLMGRVELRHASDEYDDVWELQIVDDGKTVCGHIPVDTSGLMCSILYRTYCTAYQKGREQGQLDLIDRVGADVVDRTFKLSIVHRRDLADLHPALAYYTNHGHLPPYAFPKDN